MELCIVEAVAVTQALLPWRGSCLLYGSGVWTTGGDRVENLLFRTEL
jgi:hypothetical protein